MNKTKLSVFATGIGMFVFCAPAHAGKNDDAWAKCLWQTVPRSADKWLSMPVPKRDYGLKPPPAEYILQYRLQGSCHEKLTADGKKSPPSFNAKPVREALLRTKPPEIGSDAVDPKAFRCARYFVNDTEFKNPAAYTWGFGEGPKKRVLLSIVYFFASEGGGSVGLPDAGGLEKCQWIMDDGTFTDA